MVDALSSSRVTVVQRESSRVGLKGIDAVLQLLVAE